MYFVLFYIFRLVDSMLIKDQYKEQSTKLQVQSTLLPINLPQNYVERADDGNHVSDHRAF
jgi:hypothetical protein